MLDSKFDPEGVHFLVQLVGTRACMKDVECERQLQCEEGSSSSRSSCMTEFGLEMSVMINRTRSRPNKREFKG